MKEQFYKELKTAGYQVYLRYQDPRKGGWRLKLAIGGSDKYDEWPRMDGERTQEVLAIIRKYRPDAKVAYYYGLDACLVAIVYFKKR